MLTSKTITGLAICIPTFRRAHLLEKLILDLAQQAVQPDLVVVVDGDSSSGEVSNLLYQSDFPHCWQVVYVPANHSNLPYQRYLGWRVAKNSRYLIYFDDDLRIHQPDAVKKIVTPLLFNCDSIVGVTAPTLAGNGSQLEGTEALTDRSRSSTMLGHWFGSSRQISPGDLTPTGSRVAPRASKNDYEEVKWMYGRVMAYDLTCLREEHFSRDLFAMYEQRLGKAEDTFLSRQIIPAGRILIANDTVVEHPDADLPSAYPYKAKALAYATAYSRRFLNDHYRVTEPPHFSDRVALVKSYVGNTLLNWWRAFTSFKAYRFAYAWGYMLGAMRGLVQRPTAQNLTPDIDWGTDAEEALANVQIIQSGANRG